MKLEGLDGVLKNMRNLEEKVQRKHVWGATMAGAKVIERAAKSNAQGINDPSTPSSIAPFIKSRRAGKMAKKAGGAAYRVGVVGGAKGNLRNPPQYWRHVEFGTEDTRAQPFLRPAMNKASEVYSAIANSLSERIKKEIK